MKEREIMEEEEENNNNTEPEISSNSSSQQNPKSKSSRITQDQLTKFQELQRRRLQLKSKLKKKKPKSTTGERGKIPTEDLNVKGSLDDESKHQELKETGMSSGSRTVNPPAQAEVHPALRKRKLHWGLETKERWERKANM